MVLIGRSLKKLHFLGLIECQNQTRGIKILRREGEKDKDTKLKSAATGAKFALKTVLFIVC